MFHAKRVSFLGFIIESGRLKTDERRSVLWPSGHDLKTESSYRGFWALQTSSDVSSRISAEELPHYPSRLLFLKVLLEPRGR